GGGRLVKEATQTQITTMDGRQVPTKMIFKDLEQKGHQTILTINSIRFTEDIQERYFSMQYLEKGQ
ncbi:MAG TPA: outer membrane lipoprotein-sorting protein, partial [Bacillota bacterium]